MTTENIVPEVPVVEKNLNGSGCLGLLGWFFSGAVLPFGSFTFYRKATQKSVGNVILFFTAFTLFISTLSTINLGVKLFSMITDIQDSYTSGKIPEITIAGGVAEVKGEQPFYLVNGRSNNSNRNIVIVVDTTGEITEIDTSRYDQGILLTRDELQVYNPQQNGYQRMPLYQLNTMFNRDPIIINAQTVSQAWGIMSLGLVILAFLWFVFWYIIVRLMIISTIALILWGIVSLIKPNTGFGPVIITGLYAIVPAIYLSYLFHRSGFTLPGVQTFFLLVFWFIGLLVNLLDIKFFTEEHPLRLWTAWLGLPMLILFVADIFFQFSSPYGPIALWVITVLTLLGLIGSRVYFRFKDQIPPSQPVA